MKDMRRVLEGTSAEYGFLSDRFDQVWYKTNPEWYESKCVQKAIEKIKLRYDEYLTRFHGGLYTPFSGKTGDELDHHIIVVHGGNNGSGLWRDYIDQIADFIHELEHSFSRVWMIELGNNCCDDVYTMVLGARR